MLKDWSSGNEAALDSLTPIVYQELRKPAAAKLRRENDARTLQPPALIREAYPEARTARPGALALARAFLPRRQPHRA